MQALDAVDMGRIVASHQNGAGASCGMRAAEARDGGKSANERRACASPMRPTNRWIDEDVVGS